MPPLIWTPIPALAPSRSTNRIRSKAPSDARKSAAGSVAVNVGTVKFPMSVPVAEVSLDRKTGKIKVLNFWAALDAGIAVQPRNLAAQTEGSIVYALG